MTIFAAIHYNTSKSSRSIASYGGLELRDATADDGDVTGRLIQSGEVANDIAYQKGVFQTKREAVRALLEYVSANCLLIVSDPVSGAVRLAPLGYSGGRVLGANNPTGRYVAR